MSTEGVAANAAILNSDKKDAIVRHFHGLLSGAVAAGFDPAARDLYFDTFNILLGPEPEETVKARFDALGDSEKAAYTKLRLVHHILTTVAEIVADRNLPESGNAYNIESMIRLAKAAGYSASDLEKFWSDVDIRKTSTSHPNEYLNQPGIRLFRELVGLADLPAERRAESAARIIKNMLAGDITPTTRINMFEETDAAIEQHRIYRAGQRIAFRRINEAVAAVYGDHINPPDLANPRSQIKVVQHAWEFGGDSDGKINSDRWAFLYGMMASTRAAVHEHLADLVRAEEMTARESNAPGTSADAVATRFQNMKTVLRELEDRFDRLESRFVTKDADGRKILKPGVDYGVVREEYFNIYGGLKIDNEYNNVKIGKPLTFSRPFDFYRELEDSCRIFAEQAQNPNAREILRESHHMLRQYGLTIAKIETRHSGLVYKDIMENLFSDREFLDAAKISPLEFSGVSFADLGHDRQVELMETVERNVPPAARRAALLRSNPADIKNGYVVQTHEVLERLALEARYPSKFGMGIVSDAGEMSLPYQQFIADSFNLKKMEHTALPENYETLRKMDVHLGQYHERGGGKENMHLRMLQDQQGGLAGASQTHMVPCSDALRLLGRLVTYLQAEGVRATTIQAIKHHFAVLIKWGNGVAMERGGDDDMAYTRLVAQSIQQYAKDRGSPLDPGNSEDRVLLRMAAFQSNTEQGRAKRFYSSTAPQVSNGLCDKLGEMLGRRLELQGLVKEGTFIPKLDEFSTRMRKTLNDTAYDAMTTYTDFRTAKTKDRPDGVMNAWAEVVSNMDMVNYANSSPRAASKTTARLSDIRAIGAVDAHREARTNHDGFFTAGAFMDDLHEDFLKAKISNGDVKDFILNAQWWRRNFFLRAFTAAVGSDLKHGFKKMGRPERWTYDFAMQTGASVRLVDRNTFEYDNPAGDITPEEAYQAKIFYDQVLFVGLTESALAMEESPASFSRTREQIIAAKRPAENYPGDNYLGVSFGKRIHDRWKELDSMRLQAHQALPEYMITDWYQSHEGGSEADRRAAMAAFKEGLFPARRQLLGKTSWGRQQLPVKAEEVLVSQRFSAGHDPEAQPVYRPD